jgi:4-hydroxyphenylpyruvate dioxygenase
MRGAAPAQLDHIDHLAIAVPPGAVAEYAAFYENVFGFKLFFEEETITEYSSMKSKVVQNSNKNLTLVFVEPSSGKRKSPIEEYLTYYQGPGVHHIALSCKDIIRSVGTLKDAGLEFTFTPATYYEMLPQRIGSIAEDIECLSSLGILADRDHNGYLLQVFSQPLQDRPTFFFEIIQRAGAQGFGSGNIKALFEAIERAQVARGNA